VRKTIFMTTLAAGALTLAACANGSSGTGSSNAGGSSTTAGSSSAAAAAAELATAKTSLGTVVVDGKGMTVYEFDTDTVGAAATACTGTCASLWPEVTSTSSTPVVTGVTGMVGTAAGLNGAQQVTLDGHRLYTFSGDSQAGQVNGQAFMNIWWVLSPAGQLIKGSAASTSSSASSSAAGGPSY
jgi:predicted lipoprotein with Yx(FWY)xxD motif